MVVFFLSEAHNRIQANQAFDDCFQLQLRIAHNTKDADACVVY